MTTTSHHAHVSWDASGDDLRAHTLTLGEQRLAGSSAPDFGGDARKADPEGLFVAALSACHMLWFLDFARRERLRVVAYEDDAAGTMDGTRFTEVVLRPRVRFESEVSPFAMEPLHERAHEACFIASSVSCPVRVEPA